MLLWKRRPILFFITAIIIAGIGYSFYLNHRKKSAFNYFDLGKNLTYKRDYLNANIYFIKSLELDSNSENAPYVMYLMASNYIALTAYSQAIEEYKRLINRFPGHEKAADAQFMIGIIYRNCIGNRDKALESFERYLLNYPNGKSIGEVKSYVKKLKRG